MLQGRAQSLAENILDERKKNLTTRRQVHRIQTQRRSRYDAEVPREVSVALYDSSGSEDHLAAADPVGRTLPMRRGQIIGSRSPDCAQQSGGQFDSEKLNDQAVGLND